MQRWQHREQGQDRKCVRMDIYTNYILATLCEHTTPEGLGEADVTLERGKSNSPLLLQILHPWRKRCEVCRVLHKGHLTISHQAVVQKAVLVIRQGTC